MAVMTWAVVFSALFALGCPIAYSMFISSSLYLLLGGVTPAVAMDHMFIALENKFIIAAVPLFIFAAHVMNEGKVTERLFSFAGSIVGPLKGGLAHVNVVASIIFAGMTGSEIADEAGLGLIEIKAMREAGYGTAFACAVTAASATIGPIIPPSIPMIIYALLSGTSVGYLFLGGFIPGFIMAALYMVLIYFISRKRNYPTTGKLSLRRFGVSLKKGILPLMTPVILLGGIYGGVFTPTEAAAVCAFYAVILSLFVYRTINLKQLYSILTDTVMAAGFLVFIATTAFLFSYVVTREGIGVLLANWVVESGLAARPWLLLLFFNILFLFLGCFINTSTLQWIVIPLLLPIVRAAGIDLVHFGVIAVFNMMIGLDTPPYGMSLFIMTGLTGVSFSKLTKEILPFIAMEVSALLICTFIPSTVLFLPRLFGYSG